jgi:hypothetical protein
MKGGSGSIDVSASGPARGWNSKAMSRARNLQMPWYMTTTPGELSRRHRFKLTRSARARSHTRALASELIINLLAVSTVASIPLNAVLSIRTSSLSSPLSFQTNRALALSTHLTHEICLGSRSEFWGYLQSLPDPAPQLPTFWPSSAKRWAKGTELGKLLEDEWTPVRSNTMTQAEPGLF